MTNIRLLINKKTMTMKAQRLTLHKQAKIVEAIDEGQQLYTILFYKNEFIQAKKTTAIKQDSFLRQAYQQGTTYDTNHPLVSALLSEDKTYRVISSNQLFEKLKGKYTPIEMLYVLSMLDNFLSHEKIQKLAKTVFYQQRRNGQVKKAFRTLINYLQIRPNDRFAKDMLHHIDFQRYKETYEQKDTLMANWTDPLYIEATNYRYDQPLAVLKTLANYFQQNERTFDELAIRYGMIRNYSLQDESSELERISQLIASLLNEEQQCQLWLTLLDDVTEPSYIINHIADCNGEQYLLPYFLDRKTSPQSLDHQLIETAIRKTDAKTLLDLQDQLWSTIHDTYRDQSSQLESIFKLLIQKLLPYVTPNQLMQEIGAYELPIVQRLTHMQELEDNPDKQFQLGMIYFELELYDAAISCFEWEMELSPTDSQPLQYLHKAHLAKGDSKTAENYKQLLINLQSRAASS
ncbi:hypothetical protein J416_02524 [Gracilibacillus halophilus YIM-C55.5]|uniref:Uncharacterized protein n=1 Tax=Gracilibacillus halophilus YIM-C55.5 TaxID=1308866 RepID=N4WY57_9BACI|nr:hypothetical protein [Gracilibacillus halophilus]ENH97991.1 hypothetical protein J416_02524 [Gracilibacillus halophilus YIM-C55.5]